MCFPQNPFLAGRGGIGGGVGGSSPLPAGSSIEQPQRCGGIESMLRAFDRKCSHDLAQSVSGHRKSRQSPQESPITPPTPPIHPSTLPRRKNAGVSSAIFSPPCWQRTSPWATPLGGETVVAKQFITYPPLPPSCSAAPSRLDPPGSACRLGYDHPDRRSGCIPQRCRRWNGSSTRSGSSLSTPRIDSFYPPVVESGCA